MTTEFLDNQVRTFRILLSWCFTKKKRFGMIFLSAPPCCLLFENANLVFIFVSPSLIIPAEPNLYLNLSYRYKLFHDRILNLFIWGGGGAVI